MRGDARNCGNFFSGVEMPPQAARSATVIDRYSLGRVIFFTETMRFRSEFQIPSEESTRPRRGIARIGMKTGRNTFKILGLLEAAGGDARATWPGRPRPERLERSYTRFHTSAQRGFRHWKERTRDFRQFPSPPSRPSRRHRSSGPWWMTSARGGISLLLHDALDFPHPELETAEFETRRGIAIGLRRFQPLEHAGQRLGMTRRRRIHGSAWASSAWA
jgi:hypothetical protein